MSRITRVRKESLKHNLGFVFGKVILIYRFSFFLNLLGRFLDIPILMPMKWKIETRSEIILDGLIDCVSSLIDFFHRKRFLSLK